MFPLVLSPTDPIDQSVKHVVSLPLFSILKTPIIHACNQSYTELKAVWSIIWPRVDPEENLIFNSFDNVNEHH